MLKGFWSWRSRKRFCHRMFVEGKVKSYFFRFAVNIGGLLLRPTVHADVSWNQTSFCRHLHRRCLDVVSCPALPHVKMLPYNLTRQTSFLLPVLLFVAVNIRLCKLMESEEVGKTVVPIFRPDICHFSPQMYFWEKFFSTWKRVNCGKNFATKQHE